MSKVAMVGKLKCVEGKNEEFEAALADMTTASAEESGVEIYSYHRGDDNVYWFFGLMSSHEAMQGHGQTEAMKAAMGAAFSVIDGQPEMSMAIPVSANGFDI